MATTSSLSSLEAKQVKGAIREHNKLATGYRSLHGLPSSLREGNPSLPCWTLTLKYDIARHTGHIEHERCLETN